MGTQAEQHMLTHVDFLECFEEQNVCQALIVYQNFSDNPSSYVHFDDHGIIVIRGFQLEILFCESDLHLGPLWSGSWTVVDDGVYRPEVVVCLFLSFEFRG
jgi:hypothetical protein